MLGHRAAAVVGVLAGFGAGAMLAAISFDLVAETEGLDPWELGMWMLAGVAVFLLGDRIVEQRFGSEGTGGAMGIVVGSVVDGVPESIILGIQLAASSPGWPRSWDSASPWVGPDRRVVG